MPRTFGNDCDELKDAFTAIGDLEAQSLIWQATKDLHNEHPWSFCLKEGRIVTEASYAEGTVAITKNTTAMVLTGGTWDAAWTNRRITLEGRSEPYDVASFLAGSGTLSQNFIGETLTAGTYEIWREIYSLPSDAELGQVLVFLDPQRMSLIRMRDFVVQTVRSAYGYHVGSPWSASFVGMDSAAGNVYPKVRFDPPPKDVEVYLLWYFQKPTKPASLTLGYSPIWPDAYDDLRVRRAKWQYAANPRHPHWKEKDLKHEYYERLFDAKRQFDGGNAIDRMIQTTYPALADEDAMIINGSFIGSYPGTVI